MPTITQYSPEPAAIPFFHKGFIYRPREGGEGVTSINKLRQLSASYGVINITKNLILALVVRAGGTYAQTAINTYGHITHLCYVDVLRYKNELINALLSGKIRGKVVQGDLFPETLSSSRIPGSTKPSAKNENSKKGGKVLH